MAFGSDSKVFVTWIQAVMGNGDGGSPTTKVPTGYTGLQNDVVKVALYGNGGTPSNTDSAAHAAYNGASGPWVTDNELSDTNWAAGGRALSSKTTNSSGNVFTFDAAILAGGGNVSIDSAYGCLVYDDTVTAVADLGVCYNAFGSAQTVTAGTFTIVWDDSGIFTVTAT